MHESMLINRTYLYKIVDGFLFLHLLVIRRIDFNVGDIVRNDVRIVANRLDEEEFDGSLVVAAGVEKPLAPFYGGVGAVVDRNLPLDVEPIAHVLQSSGRALSPNAHRLNIIALGGGYNFISYRQRKKTQLA